MERYLDYDSAGFIVGINHVKDAIDSVQDDTQEIIGLMTAQAQIGQTKLTEISKKLSEANHHHRAAARKQIRPTSRISNVRTLASPTSSGQSTRAVTARISSNQQTTSPSQQPQNRVADPTVSSARISTPQDLTDQASNNQGGSNTPARRDSRGRFVSEGSTEQEYRLNAIARDMMNARIGVDSGGYDPLVDSVRELGTVMSPLGQVGKMGMRGVKFSVSKLKALKRREPLPQDQSRHNRENEVLLDKIWKAIRNIDSSGGGGGLLGGLLGGGGRRGGRGGRVGKLKNLAGRVFKAVGGFKGLSILSGLAGSAALAMDWDNLDHKGKSAGLGGLAGMSVGGVIGGTLGAVGGPLGMAAGAAIGGWLGSEGGEALGAAASPYIDSWSRSVVAYNLPKKMGDVWERGISPFFDKLTETASSIQSWFGTKWDGAKEFFGFGDSNGDSTAISDRASKAADYVTRNALSKSAGWCARYVRKALQAADYEIETQPYAYQYETNGTLSKAGLTKIDPNTKPRKGDVMVIQPTKGHNAGHIQMYNGEQWVSDFKQNSISPYNGVDIADLDRTLYRDMSAGEKTPFNHRSASQRSKANEAIDFFMAKGYTKAQAVGIAANLQQESGFDHQAVGDNGHAFGLAQWHKDRQANFKKDFGKPIQQASFKEQLEFIYHEMNNGSEQRAGRLLRQANNEQQAAAIVSEYYERPKQTEAERKHRANIAKGIMSSRVVSDSKTAKAKSTDSTLGFEMGNMTSSLAPASTGYRPAGLPVIRQPSISPLPIVSQRLDSGGVQKPIILQASNDTISQNVSDRGIAHAVTGGLGRLTN